MKTRNLLIGLLTAAVLLLCLAGCGSAPAVEDNPQPQSSSEEAVDSAVPEEIVLTPAERFASPSVTGALQVQGTKLTDSQGNPVQLRGVSTHGLSWFPEYVNQDCFHQLRQEWGANVVRLAMYTADYNGYREGGDQEALKELVRKGVDAATAEDLYVIIDWHTLSDGDPNIYKDDAKAFFTEMSAAYADHTNVLYEICNEPNGPVEWAQVKAYAEEVIPCIRANDPDAVILVGTPDWCQRIEQAAADPITEFDNVMYTVHFYAASHKDDLRNAMVAAVESGLPVFVSEYGICDASGNGEIDEAEADKWVETMDELDISYVMWNLSNKAESASILKDTCTKTSGFAEDDRSQAGQWLFDTLTSHRDN